LAITASVESRKLAQQRWNAIGPDRPVFGMGEGLDAGRLQPVDAYRLLVARLILKTDRDEVAGLEHLGRGFGEARLVAVERGHGENPGQAGDQGDQSGEERPPPAARPAVQSLFRRHGRFIA